MVSLGGKKGKREGMQRWCAGLTGKETLEQSFKGGEGSYAEI